MNERCWGLVGQEDDGGFVLCLFLPPVPSRPRSLLALPDRWLLWLLILPPRSPQAYWKVKNSWGQTWGMEGYVLLAKGTDECGIADGPPSYPTGVKAPSTGSEDIYGA